MDNRIRHRAFTSEIKERLPCSNNLRLQSEKIKVLSDIKLLSFNGLATPKANEKLAKISTRLNDCLLCKGDCECGK